MPTLVLHGDDDQIVPIDITGRRTVKLVKDARLVEVKGAPHGMCTTHKDRINAELLKFFQEPGRRARAGDGGGGTRVGGPTQQLIQPPLTPDLELPGGHVGRAGHGADELPVRRDRPLPGRAGPFPMPAGSGTAGIASNR